MKFLIIFFASLMLTFVSCKSTATLAEIASLKEAVSKENFEIVATVANPVAFANVRGIENLLPPGSNINNINLMSNPNYFRVQKDSIDLDLPFYGERHFAGNYGSDAGFNFKGKINKKKTTFRKKNNSYLIDYWLNNDTESLRVSLILFANKSSNLTVNSNHRSTINYRGNWKKLEN